MSGSRYSLRRVIGNTLVASIATFVAATGWFWAAKNAQRPYLLAIPYVEIGAAVAATYTSLEPFLRVIVDTLRSRRLNTGAIKLTGWGFTVWWAFIIAATVFWQSSKFAYLHAWLVYLHSLDYYFADVKFLVAVTLAMLPIVVAVRQGLILFDGTAISGGRAPGVSPLPSRPTSMNGAPRYGQIPPGSYPQAPRSATAPPPPRAQPPPPPRSPYIVPPRTARIISVDSTPSPNDRERGK
jgi:hypothetical protein